MLKSKAMKTIDVEKSNRHTSFCDRRLSDPGKKSLVNLIKDASSPSLNKFSTTMKH